MRVDPNELSEEYPAERGRFGEEGPNFYSALEIAAENGHVAVVDCLLRDPRVDPTQENVIRMGDQALIYAVRNSHLLVVRRLLEDDRIDPSQALIEAMTDNNLDLIQLILTSPRTNPDSVSALEIAIIHDDDQTVALLLADGRANPAANRNNALKLARIGGNRVITEMLLADPRVDPTVVGPPPRGGGSRRTRRRSRRRHLKQPSMRRNHTSKRRRW